MHFGIQYTIRNGFKGEIFMKKSLLGYYNYTVVLTYMGMLSAFTGILRLFEKDFSGAIIFLMLAGACDMFDGKVAATKERDTKEKNFGIQIDSLSDLISFGVLPGLFVYIITEKTFASAVISSLYVLAALIRLAYFNVLEEERQKTTTGSRTVYLGMPVTTIAVLLPAFFMIYDNLYRSRNMFLGLMAAVSLLFLLPKEVKKPNIIGKIGLIIIGILEILGLIFLMGWDSI